MLLSRSFVVGLFVYVRQAALSLHRAPESFLAAMRNYYDAHQCPRPEHVVARIDATVSTRADVLGRLLGSSIPFTERELSAVRQSLHELQAILDGQAVESAEEQIRVRLALAEVEELLRRKLGRQSHEVGKVEHLNETPGLGQRPFAELAGVEWPDSK